MKSICNILCQFFVRGYVMCSTFNFPLISLGLLVETPTDLPRVTCGDRHRLIPTTGIPRTP